jgi:60 kDa SS-A/Ro ribonucleoprotein
MASKTLFKGATPASAAPTTTVNEAGGVAYAFGPKHALAQYAATGCLNGTYYASDEDQLKKVLALCAEIESEFIGKVALYAREKSFMKDMPALLCAVLAARAVPNGDATKAAEAARVLKAVFPRVIDNGKMLRNFAQIVRSGAVGRKSFGSMVKRLMAGWFAARSTDQIFYQSVGTSPSLGDIVRMVHPKPATPEHAALYGYMIGKTPDVSKLPAKVVAFEAWKKEPTGDVPDVPFQMLTALPLTTAQWTEIARKGGWTMVRMNLNTFARHGVFQDAEMVEALAQKLRDPEEVRKARAFPYQLLMAFSAAGDGVPEKLRLALQDAMEIATESVPKLDGHVVVCPDVSGSMGSPVTGYRQGSTTNVSCVQVAALVAASVLRQNPEAAVMPFDTSVHKVKLNPRDSVMTNANTLAKFGGGGTACAEPLKKLVASKAKVDAVIYVSDNESWIGTGRYGQTEVLDCWNEIKKRNPKAKMVCIDIQAYGSTQAPDRDDVLNIGGFSDTIFEVVASFLKGESADHWTEVIEQMKM